MKSILGSVGRRTSGARCHRAAVVVLALALSGLVYPALASAQSGPALLITDVSCAASGYQFTISGTGFPASSTAYVFIADNVYTGTEQFLTATTDASGSFTVVENVAGPGQEVPATVTVGDKTYLRSGGTSGTLYPVSATVIPPDCSTVVAVPPATTTGSASTVTLTTVDPTTGTPLGAVGAGRGVTFTTTLGTFPGGCTSGCLATDNGDGTYSLPLTSAVAGTATVTATINDPTYGTVPVTNTATVTFTTPPAPDLSVTKTTNPAGVTSVTAGSPIGYTITVTNHGNADAPGVTLVDTATGGSITALSASGATCTASTGKCSLGTIPAGGTVTVAETVSTSAAGTVTNSVTVATTGPETDLGDNTATAPPVTVTAPPPPPSGSCNEPGLVLSGAHWSMQTSSVVNRKTVVTKHDVYVVIEADCDYDATTHKTVLQHAFVFVYVDGSPLILATTDSALGKVQVTNATLSGPNATLTGSYNGTPFTVTLYDGGYGRNGSDTVRVQYGSFDTATLSAPHCAAVVVLD